jgi:hypothetical protein
VLAVSIPRLLDCEDAWGMRIELVPSLGTPVPSGGILFRTSAPVGRAQCRALESALAFGDVLSPASRPFGDVLWPASRPLGAIRAMVDIAFKAHSPAVNDPSRAVQALDEIEDVLGELAPDVAPPRGGPGAGARPPPAVGGAQMRPCSSRSWPISPCSSLPRR